ncbi:MAG: hypothetical protein Q9181_005602 [Wetmoreana brouardii]
MVFVPRNKVSFNDDIVMKKRGGNPTNKKYKRAKRPKNHQRKKKREKALTPASDDDTYLSLSLPLSSSPPSYFALSSPSAILYSYVEDQETECLYPNKVAIMKVLLSKDTMKNCVGRHPQAAEPVGAVSSRLMVFDENGEHIGWENPPDSDEESHYRLLT